MEGKETKNKKLRSIPFWLCLIVSVSLIVGGFFVPPMGVIDGSVLTATGILFGFGALGQIPLIIEQANTVRIIKGDTTIEATKEPTK